MSNRHSSQLRKISQTPRNLLRDLAKTRRSPLQQEIQFTARHQLLILGVRHEIQQYRHGKADNVSRGMHDGSCTRDKQLGRPGIPTPNSFIGQKVHVNPNEIIGLTALQSIQEHSSYHSPLPGTAKTRGRLLLDSLPLGLTRETSCDLADLTKLLCSFAALYIGHISLAVSSVFLFWASICLDSSYFPLC